MRTSEEIYHQIRWDPRFDPARFVLGIRQRGAAPKRVALPRFVPGGEIPWHRVIFIEADGELVWDRATGVDHLKDSGRGRAHQPRRLSAPFAARTPYRWRPVDGWGPAGPGLDGPPTASGVSAAPGARVRVLTWNTLWDRYDGERINTAQRRPLLLAALERADADVIALQEVEPALADLLRQAPWVRHGYTLSTDPGGADIEAYGLLLLSRLPVLEAGTHELGPHKSVSAITVTTASGPLAVATTHLTSDHTKDGGARRKAELVRIAEVLVPISPDLVLLGDFNDGGEGPDDGPGAALGLRDAWTQTRDPLPTFDPGVNPLAAVSSLSGRAGRLDRVLLGAGRLRTDAAALRGESPTPFGQYLSDHYGVQIDLLFGAVAATDALDAAPTARTALAWIPPGELWPAIQAIRRVYDPQLHRWPPHINVLFGFVPESEFERAAALLSKALGDIMAFTARLDGVRTFQHRDDGTVWLDPAASDTRPWAALREATELRFPGCAGGWTVECFTPHLTLALTRDPGRVATECAQRLGPVSAGVDELTVLSHRGDEPMRPRFTIALGSGEVRWLPEPAAEPAWSDTTGRDVLAGRAERLIREALPEGIVHRVGSRRMGCALAGADLDLVAVLPGTVNLADIMTRVAAALPDASGIREVIGARVPGLRLRLNALDIDLSVVASGSLGPAAALARRAELGEAAAVSLSGVSDAAAILAAVGETGRTRFAELARRVKAWAKARGLDSAPFGGLPGLAWVVLAARTTIDNPEAPDDDLPLLFFGTWAAWDWRQPIALTSTAGRPHTGPVAVMTASSPVRSCTEQVSPGGRDLLTDELYRAWEVLEQAALTGADPWPDLLAPPPLHRRHRSWAVVTVCPPRPAEFDETVGRMRGRLRALLAVFDELGAWDRHAWPRPFDSGPALARYAIGLGRTSPDRSRFAELTEQWCAGLPGVTVGLAECGAVPSLR